MQFAEDFLTSKKEILNIIPQWDRYFVTYKSSREYEFKMCAGS